MTVHFQHLSKNLNFMKKNTFLINGFDYYYW